VYAVILTGGKQYKVQSGDKIKVEKIDAPVGAKIKIPNVLLAGDDKEITLDIGKLAKANVEGKILSHGKNKKVTSFKKRRRKGYQRKIGHRQNFTEVLIEKINL
jgi:large subunit ribosomal protein L21